LYQKPGWLCILVRVRRESNRLTTPQRNPAAVLDPSLERSRADRKIAVAGDVAPKANSITLNALSLRDGIRRPPPALDRRDRRLQRAGCQLPLRTASTTSRIAFHELWFFAYLVWPRFVLGPVSVANRLSILTLE
jgi:hypothetical protein